MVSDLLKVEAALKSELPDWLAVIVQVPTANV